MNTKLISRLSGVSLRLENQLKSNVRRLKEGILPLTDKDVARISREKEAVNNRIFKLRSR